MVNLETTAASQVESAGQKSSGAVRHPKFLTLDALRGVAATAVMIFHFGPFFGMNWFTHGYLAVDFFFMLSGFVIHLAYQEKLDSGWPSMAFLKVRVARLYPLYLLGLLLGALHLWFGHTSTLRKEVLPFLLLNMLFLPVPVGYGDSKAEIFPTNGPSWSLFFEMIANVVHATLLRRRGTRFLASIMAVCIALSIYFMLRAGDANLGWRRNELLVGLARVLSSYILGMLLYRLWKAAGKSWRGTPLLPAALLLLCLVGWTKTPSALVEAAIIYCAFPLILMMGTYSQPSRRFAGVSEFLGTSSYALYVLHAPIGQFYVYLWKHVRHHDASLDAPWSALIYFGLMFALVYAVDKYYDVPVRGYLRRVMTRSKA